MLPVLSKQVNYVSKQDVLIPSGLILSRAAKLNSFLSTFSEMDHESENADCIFALGQKFSEVNAHISTLPLEVLQCI